MRKDKDGLFKHSLILFAATQLANASNLLFHIAMGRGLPKDEYSSLAALLNLMLIIGTPLEALRTAVAHFAARVVAAGQPGALGVLLRSWGWKMIAVGLAVTAAAFVGRGFIMEYLHLSSHWSVIITSVTLIGILLIPPLAGALQGLQAFGWMAASLQGLSVLRLAVGALLVWFVSRTALSGIVAQFVGVYAAVACGVLGLFRILRHEARAEVSTAYVGGYLLRSFVVLAAFAVLMNIDIILVRHYLTEESKLFARAATIARTIIFLPMPIALAMFPKVVSTGGVTSESRRTLLKALAMVALIIGGGALACTLIPQVPLVIMYNEHSAEANHLVRITLWAMAPLGITYLLMNFELAQHRFTVAPVLLCCAAAYVGGVAFWHQNVGQVVTVLAVASSASLIGSVILAWRHYAGTVRSETSEDELNRAGAQR
jgi:hypothetical protein